MKRALWLFILVLPVFALSPDLPRASSASVVCSGKWLSYEPATVKLTGMIERQFVYGPPNFGEDPSNDSKGDILVLVLDRGINVGTGQDIIDEPEKCVTRLQLVFPIVPDDAAGRRVTVVGRLFHSHTGHHFTSVLVDVEAIFQGAEKV